MSRMDNTYPDSKEFILVHRCSIYMRAQITAYQQ